jgi:glycosyltransferase involved in cell wall biosynthesis
LASEGDGTQNRELCLSNKVFTYLMAGIPVIASDTPEQLRLAQKHPEAFVVYERNRTDSLAFRIDELFETNGVREKMGIAALDLATTKYNWELVAREFLAVVRRTLDASPLN